MGGDIKMDNSMKSTVEPSIPVLDFSGGSWSNLIEIAESNRDAYIKQEPFPYVVLLSLIHISEPTRPY